MDSSPPDIEVRSLSPLDFRWPSDCKHAIHLPHPLSARYMVSWNYTLHLIDFTEGRRPASRSGRHLGTCGGGAIP